MPEARAVRRGSPDVVPKVQAQDPSATDPLEAVAGNPVLRLLQGLLFSVPAGALQVEMHAARRGHMDSDLEASLEGWNSQKGRKVRTRIMTSNGCNCGACPCRGHNVWWTSLGYWCSECKTYLDEMYQPLQDCSEARTKE